MAKKATQPYQLKTIPVDKIKISKLHWKRSYEDTEIEKLADQIASVGLIEPILLRDVDGRLELLAGAKRLRAVIKLKLSEIRAVVVKTDDVNGELMSLYENLGQGEMTPSEIDQATVRAVELETVKANKSKPDAQVINTVALQTGRRPRAVATSVRQAIKLIPEAKAALKEGKINKSQAAELEPLDTTTQKMMLKNILEEGLTSHEIRKKKAENKIKKSSPEDDKTVAHERMGKIYLKRCLSIGERFREALITFNEHMHDNKVRGKNVTDVTKTSAMKSIKTQLDEAVSYLH